MPNTQHTPGPWRRTEWIMAVLFILLIAAAMVYAIAPMVLRSE